LDRSVAWPPQERLTLSRFITAQPRIDLTIPSSLLARADQVME